MLRGSRLLKIASILLIGVSLVLFSTVVYDTDGDASLDLGALAHEPFLLDRFVPNILSLRGSVIPFQSHFHAPEAIALSLEMHEKSPPLAGPSSVLL